MAEPINRDTADSNIPHAADLSDQVSVLFSAFHAALCTTRHGVRSHPVPVAPVGECTIPVV